MSELVLSLFPGIDLLGRGFEAEGFCVVRGPDLLFGGDIQDFSPPVGKFDGVIAGSPCQDFSRARREAPTGYGEQMLSEFERVVQQAKPSWWLLENVERVPDVRIEGYSWQRLDVWAHEFGLSQRRLRHFQFGDAEGKLMVLDRAGSGGSDPAVVGSDSETPWEKFCTLQGLPEGFDLPGFTIRAKRQAVGNGVPLPMAQAVARSVTSRTLPDSLRLCGCGCGRSVSGMATYARDACRMRVSRRKKAVTAQASKGIDELQGVTQ